MHSATWINFTLIVDQKCNLRLLFSIVVNNDVWQCGAKKKPVHLNRQSEKGSVAITRSFDGSHAVVTNLSV